jgi:hypothetical protein
MRRPGRAAVGVCIAIIAVAALLPGFPGLDYAILEPIWVLLPDVVPAAPCTLCEPGPEQPLRLLSLLPSRAPPGLPLV